jgi:antitoxin component YwqK of YwqJK toxin-antitoxin module
MRNFMIASLMICSLYSFAQQKELHTFYDDGSLKSTYRYTDENNYQVTNYYPSGAIMETGSFADGKLNGVWTCFSSSGIKTGEASYRSGLREGEWNMYDESGNLRYSISYVSNKMVSANRYDVNGKLVAETHTR